MKIIDGYPSTTEDIVQELEQTIGFTLPEDYRSWILENNGGVPTPGGFEFNDLYGAKESVVQLFLPVGKEHTYNVLGQYELFTGEDRLPAEVVPIAFDPFGNMICLDLQDGEFKGTVLFWDHEMEHVESGLESNLFIVAESFSEFLQMIK